MFGGIVCPSASREQSDRPINLAGPQTLCFRPGFVREIDDLLERSDRDWMAQAIREARKAWDLDEVPVGAVVVHEGRIIGRGHNLRERLCDPTAHAEMIALTAAAEALGSWRLTGATMFVTLEPCPMCAGALVNARVDRLVYGATDPKAGACGTLFEIPTDERLNHRLDVVGGILAEEGGGLLTAYFHEKRGREKRGREK